MIERDLERFTQFVQVQLETGADDASLDELFDRWRRENPSQELYRENVSAIAASIDDFARGARGTPASQDSTDLRREFGLSES